MKDSIYYKYYGLNGIKSLIALSSFKVSSQMKDHWKDKR